MSSDFIVTLLLCIIENSDCHLIGADYKLNLIHMQSPVGLQFQQPTTINVLLL